MLNAIRAVAMRPNSAGSPLRLGPTSPWAWRRRCLPKPWETHHQSRQPSIRSPCTMAISETRLNDVMSDADRRAEQESVVLGKNSGGRGRPGFALAAVWSGEARELMQQVTKVAVVFGCWTSVSRNSGSAGFPGARPVSCLSACNTKARRRAQRVLPGAAPNQQRSRPSTTLMKD